MDISTIQKALQLINNTVQEAHPNEDDDVGAIVWNACLAIAEQLHIDLN